MFKLFFGFFVSLSLLSLQAEILFIEVKSEMGAGTRGASLGPDAMRVASLNAKSSLFKDTHSIEISRHNDLLFESVYSPHAKRIEGIIELYNNVSVEVKNAILEGNFLVVLAGDHSSAGATIAGIKMAHPEERLGVIWIDAHADAHSPYTTPSGNIHGMPVAISLGEDNLVNKINEVDEFTRLSWEQLKNTGEISPKIYPQDLVYIAVRDVEEEEIALIKNNNIKLISTESVHEFGADMIAKEALKYLSACDRIYISFDVDSMDPSVSRGTGTPAPNGISDVEASLLLEQLGADKKVCCVEFAEINPTLDTENKMAISAFEILTKIIETAECRTY
jgi:arginase